jgi:hypothetical protein
MVKREIVSCVLVASLLFSIGCSSSYEVYSSPNSDKSFSTFNADAQNRSGVIVFQDDSELEARNIVASADSTRFLNETTDVMTVVPTHTIKTVVLRSSGVGFLEGFGGGVLMGATTSAILISANPKGERHISRDWMLLGAAAGGTLGGLIGGISGFVIGHSYKYQFPTSADSAKK